MLRPACFASLLVLIAAIGTAQAGLPRLIRLTPPGGQRGTTLEVDLTGRHMDGPREILLYEPGISVESIESLEGEIEIGGRRQRVEPGTRVRVRLNIAENCPLGVHGLRLVTSSGLTDYQRFFVGPFPGVDEDETQQTRNDKPETAKNVPLNSTVSGQMNDPADIDLYRVEVKRGQRISAEVEAARIGVERGIPDLYLAILNEDGKALVETDDSALYVQDPVASVLADRDGACFVLVRHTSFNAAGDAYRLHIGTFPRPAALYPAGGPAGSELQVQILGDPQGIWTTNVQLPSNDSGHTADFPFTAVDQESSLSAPSPNLLRVSPYPNVLEAASNDTPEAVTGGPAAELPVAFNGLLERPGDVDCFLFRAKKGDRYKVRALAQAIGSPLDLTIWIKPLGPKSGGVVRATDSRLNQLGVPTAGGLQRETLDPIIEFTVPADGEYVLGVEEDRGAGSAASVYRVECEPEVDAVYTYIPGEPDNRFSPQVRQAVAVAAGNRYNTQVAIVNTNRPFNGDLELVAVGLPEGVTMVAPRLSPGMTRVPVVFEAAAGTPPQAKFIDLIVRPVAPEPVAAASLESAEKTASGETAPAAKDRSGNAPDRDSTEADASPVLVSGYRQVIPMNQYNNNDYYLHTTIDRLALAVTEPVPFVLEVEEPRSALVQNGESVLKFSVRRENGFDGSVSVSMEWRPNGINTSTPLTIPGNKSDGEYLLSASRNATAGAYQVTLTAVAGTGRGGYRDTSDRTFVSSRPFVLTIAEPHIEARIARTSVERGKTAEVVCKLNHLKPFSGKARATLARLPRGVELVEPMIEISSGDQEARFQVRATDDCLVGSYQGMTLDLTVIDEGQTMRQLSGSGMLRIDAERTAK